MSYRGWKKLDDFGKGLEVEKTDGKKYPLSKESYIDIIRRYGQEAGFSPFLKKEILCKGIW